MSDTIHSDRKIQLWKVIRCKSILKRFASFTVPFFKCNFTTTTGWKGKTYVLEHQVSEYTPALRAVDMLDIYHVSQIDTVILTEAQYQDFKAIDEE